MGREENLVCPPSPLFKIIMMILDVYMDIKCVCVYVYACMCVYVCMYDVCMVYVYVYVCVCMYVCMYICMMYVCM